MKKEYDFSNAIRGKFYRKDVQLNLPIYLDKDIADFIHKVADRKKLIHKQLSIKCYEA